MSKKWTEPEIEVLTKNYHIKTPKEIAKVVGRSHTAVRDKAEKLKLRSYKTWTEENIQFLKDNYEQAPWKLLTTRLKRSKPTIVAYSNKFGLERRTFGGKWPKEDIQFLKDNYTTMDNNDISKKLNRNHNRVVAVANNMGLRKADKAFHRKETRKIWTHKEESFIQKNYGKIRRRDIAAFLNTSISSLNHKIIKLGLSGDFVSMLEKDFEVELQKFKAYYQAQVKSKRYKIDFVVGKVAIELNGTYWHCDSRAYPTGPKYETQRKAIKRDKKKYEYLRQKGYTVVIIWEYDFYNNWNEVKSNLLAVLEGNLQDYDSANTGKG